MFDALNLTIQGKTHIKKNISCQDASDVYVDRNSQYVVAAVADGHGSSSHFRSEIGSKMAVEAAIASVNSCFREQPDNGELTLRDIWRIQNQKNSKYEDIDTILKNLEKNILYIWDEKINEYHNKYPLTPNENNRFSREIAEAKQKEVFYGTTLIVAVMTRDYHFVVKIGDGNAIIVKSDGTVMDAIDDGELYVANRTASMCDFNAIDEFFSYFSKEKILAISLSTDGLDRTFSTVEDFHRYNLLLINQLFDKQSCMRELQKDFQRKNNSGVGDDISLAIAFDVEQTDNWILNDLEKKKANLERRIKVIKDRWQLSNSGDYISDESNSVGDKSGGRNDSYKSDSDNVSGKNSKKNITNKISEALSQVNNENMEAAAESVTNLEQTAQDNMPKGQIADDKEFADNIDDCKEEPKKKKIQLPTTSIKEEVSAQIEQAIKDLDNKRLNDSEENTQRRYQDESKQESSMEDDTYFSKPKKKKWFKRSEK